MIDAKHESRYNYTELLYLIDEVFFMGAFFDWLLSNLNWIIPVIVILAFALPILSVIRRLTKGHVSKSSCTVQTVGFIRSTRQTGMYVNENPQLLFAGFLHKANCGFVVELFLKNEEDGHHQTDECRQMVPPEAVLKNKNGKHRKDGERDALLNDFELHESKRTAVADVSDAVGRHHEAVLKQRDAPGKQHDHIDRPGAEVD